MKLLVLDMDGVIFSGANFWLDLHHRLGTEGEAMALWKRHGTRRYQFLSEQTAQLWRGRSAAAYFKLIRERRYIAGVQQLVDYARDRDIRTAIISSGAWHLAARAQRDLGIDHIHANRLGVDLFGCFDGTVDVEVDNNRKDACLQRLQHRFGISKDDTVIIGDTASDALMAPLAALAIGYNMTERSNAFDVQLSGASLAPALSHIAAFDKRHEQHKALEMAG